MLDAHPTDGADAAVHDIAPPQRPAWSGVAALSLSVFGLVTAEFLPPSVLTPLASDLGVSLGAAGQAVTATAVVGAFAALLVPVVTSRWDRRLVLLGLLLLLGVSNLMTAAAVNLPMLLAARVVLGVSLGGFWSMATTTTMRLVPMPVLPRAMSIVFTGVTVATVSAAPVGAYVGDLLGWRATFLIAGLVGVAALACLWRTLPRLKPGATAGLKDLAEVAVRPRAMVVLASVVVVISGHFAGFTYIRPVLEQVVRLDVAAISLVLLAFGCAGFIGNFVGAFLAERDPKLAIITGSGLMTAAMTALVVLGATPWLAAVALTVWGLAFAMLPVGFQAWMVADVPDRPELAGGLLVDRFGVLSASVYCGAAAAAGACLVLALRRRRIAQAAACAA